MGKGKSGKSKGSDSGAGAQDDWSNAAADRLPQALREAGARAAELAQNPVARSLLAAGLVTAAAALTSSQKVRSGVREAGREAIDSAEAAADNASKIGAAIVTAATDAVRRMMAAGTQSSPAQSQPEQEPSAPAAAAPPAKPARAKKSAPKKPAAAKSATADGTKAKPAKDAKPKASKSAKPAARKRAANSDTTSSGGV